MTPGYPLGSAIGRGAACHAGSAHVSRQNLGERLVETGWLNDDPLRPSQPRPVGRRRTRSSSWRSAGRGPIATRLFAKVFDELPGFPERLGQPVRWICQAGTVLCATVT